MSKERRLIKRASALSALALLAMPLLAACGAEPTPVPAATATSGTGAGTEATATTAMAEPTATTATEEATPTTAVAEETATTGTGTGASLKVGLVTDVGRLNDKSFNQSSWEGVLQAQQELGIEARSIETVDTKDYAQNIGQFISEGYNVIVTVGFALGEATVQAAKDNPDIKFIGVDQFQSEELPNLAGLIFGEDKAGYLAGVLAASISQTNNIGAVCGTDDVPPVWKFGEGYKAGALSVKPDITVQVTYHSDVDISKTFTDPEWGKTTGLSMIDRGADILFGAGGDLPLRTALEKSRNVPTAHLMARGIGITNLVNRATARADELSPAELRTGRTRLEAFVALHHPVVVAVAGVTAYRAAFAPSARFTQSTTSDGVPSATS